MIETKKIERRIAKTSALGLKIDALEIDEAAADLIREKNTLDVLAELMECLKAGDSLEDAIQTIHINM